jgi:hypothetical protein
MTFTSIRTFLCIALPLALTAGCVQSHRAAYAYTPEYYSTPSTVTYSTPSTVTVSPTSDYPAERVYTVPNETVVTTTSPVVTSPAPLIVTGAPAGIPAGSPSASDLVLAGEIRRMISEDNNLVRASRNTRIAIYNGQVTITGTTATRDDRERLHAAMESVPGIIRLDDRVRATLEGSY